MEAFNSFHQGSFFKVPLNPFPPGVRWSSRRVMLYEVMSDLHRGWVQDFLLKTDASADARILSSPSQLCKSVSFSFACRLDCDCAQGLKSVNLHSHILAVPAFTRDDISAGVTIESNSGGAAVEVLCRSNSFMHYVRNDRTGTICTISVDDRSNFVEVGFISVASAKSNSVHLQLKFCASRFMKAFASGSVDFDLLEQSILTMAVGCSARGPIVCDCREEKCKECAGVQAQLLRVPAQKKSFADYFQCGDFYCRSVLSFYEDSVLMNAIPCFSLSSRNFGAPDFSVDKMFNWGMADRLGRLKPIPPPVLPFSLEELDEPEPGTAEEFTGLGVSTSAHDVDNILFGRFSDALPTSFSRTQESQRIVTEQDETGPYQISRLPGDIVQAIPPETVSNVAGDRVRLGSVAVLSPPKVNGLRRDEASNKGVVRIAPAPIVASNPPAQQNVGASLAPSMDKERLAKLEKRKIRKREAAFRSNAKRAERRRIAVLAKGSSHDVP